MPESEIYRFSVTHAMDSYTELASYNTSGNFTKVIGFALLYALLGFGGVVPNNESVKQVFVVSGVGNSHDTLCMVTGDDVAFRRADGAVGGLGKGKKKVLDGFSLNRCERRGYLSESKHLCSVGCYVYIKEFESEKKDKGLRKNFFSGHYLSS